MCLSLTYTRAKHYCNKNNRTFFHSPYLPISQTYCHCPFWTHIHLFPWNSDINTHSDSWDHWDIWDCTKESRKKPEVQLHDRTAQPQQGGRSREIEQAIRQKRRGGRRGDRGGAHTKVFNIVCRFISTKHRRTMQMLSRPSKGLENISDHGGGAISHVQDWIRERCELIAWLLPLEIWPQEYLYFSQSGCKGIS